ncbi:Putative teichuronic acid biosynthesis glycosyltransferase TuaH [Roseimaritima multifibrata]|uniref:Teichuronic acid biosynthesis glycosyltransferase TuaH n=2 Tax=Roseimaritima multifibrata TaxID=1930274 RepID=A0A517MN86_9BACT|nr:Putative teichuronic acid biosynthesis glycosyltransferase TuaH [Roseimaritima multifibrata]
MLAATDVVWVNTIGMRPPRLDWVTVRRGWEKLRGAGQQARGVGDPCAEISPRVLNPHMWPWMSHAWDRRLNASLLAKQLAVESDVDVAVTTIPIVADLVDRLPVRRWVYYCVDDFSVWPGLAGSVMAQMEKKLIAKVDRVVAASDFLASHSCAEHSDVSVLTHGVDRAFWRRGESGEFAGVAAIPGPRVVFWGVVDQRMNAEWVLALADQLTSGSVVLAGPQQNPDSRLLAHSRIHLTGALPFEQLPALAKMADALIMPYADLPVTRAMQPLKLKEYLATERPVIASPLPAVLPWDDCLQIARTEEQFVQSVLQVLAAGSNGAQQESRVERVRERLSNESWAAKAAQFRKLILE